MPVNRRDWPEGKTESLEPIIKENRHKDGDSFACLTIISVMLKAGEKTGCPTNLCPKGIRAGQTV